MNAAETIHAAIEKVKNPDVLVSDEDLIIMCLELFEPVIDLLEEIYEARRVERNWETLVYVEAALPVARAILGGPSDA